MYSTNENHLIFRMMRSRVTSIAVLVVFAVSMFCSLLLCNSKNIVIIDGAVSRSILTNSNHPGQILEQAGLSPLDEDDDYSVDHLSTVTASYTIERTHNVILSVYGNEMPLTSEYSTVERFLINNNIPFGANDVITPPLHTYITQDCTVRIDTVVYTEQTIEEAVACSTVYIQSDTISKGHSRVMTEGVDGRALNTYSVKTVNGKPQEVKLVSQQILCEPIDEKVLVGNKVLDDSRAVSAYNSQEMPVISTIEPDIEILLDSTGRPVQYKELITGTASAYTANGGDVWTATGAVVQTGYVAIDPDIIPYGSKLFIRTSDDSYIYGYAIAADTGGFTEWGTRIVDLYFPTESECVNFGLRNVELYVIE